MGLTGRPTGSPKPDALNTGNYSKTRHKGTKHNPFKHPGKEHGQPVTRTYKVERYLTGLQERYVENAFGETEKKLMLTVIDCVTDGGKANNRTGPRKYKRAQTLNAKVHSVPTFARKALEKRLRRKLKGKRERKGFTVTIGEDGCTNVAVRSHLFVHGYTAKNKHSVAAPATQYSGGTVLDNTAWEVVKIELIGSGKLKTAQILCRQPGFKKRITIQRVRNRADARAMLKSIHGIE